MARVRSYDAEDDVPICEDADRYPLVSTVLDHDDITHVEHSHTLGGVTIASPFGATTTFRLQIPPTVMSARLSLRALLRVVKPL